MLQAMLHVFHFSICHEEIENFVDVRTVVVTVHRGVTKVGPAVGCEVVRHAHTALFVDSGEVIEIGRST